MNVRALKTGFISSTPLMLGYLPVAVAFGIVAIQAEIPVWGAVLLSAAMFSGASQFLFIAMISTAMPLWMAFLLCLLVNSRHVFYGALLSPWLGDEKKRLALCAFGLTDEVFAVAQARLGNISPAQRHPWLLGLEFGAYAMWVLGTAVGAVASESLSHSPEAVTDALQFALPALFFLLLVPYLSRTMSLGTLISFFVAAIATCYDQAAVGIVAAAIAGTVVFMGVNRWKKIQ